MYDRKLVHEVKGLQDLDRESLGESHRKALEIIVFHELIKVDAQHFKTHADVVSESKFVFDTHNVLAIFVVIISESLQDFNLDLSLLMEFLPVFQNLYTNVLLIFVVKTSQNDTESTPSKLLLDFISVLNLVLGFIKKISLLIIKAVIING